MFFVLHVDGTHRLRDIVVGTKHLPDPDSHERAWAFVALVSDQAEDLAAEGQTAMLPEHLRNRFGGRRFAQLDAPEWLDHEGVELVIIGAALEPARELGLDLDPQGEQAHDADLLRDLRIRPGDLSLEPLRSGKLR